jgi:hypothetical protein
MKYPECYIYHHLGLGDHLICNGLVRYLIKSLDLKDVSLVVKKANLNNVKRMFIDKPEVSFFPISNDEEFINHYNNQNDAILCKIGFEKCRNDEFDKSFYDSVAVPFSERWNSWYLQRDTEQESRVYDALDIKEDYIFVHDDSSVGSYNLNINSTLRQIKPSKIDCEKSIFDWIKVIENAKEVHAIGSSFAHLINSLCLKNNLYFHDIKHSHKMYFTLRQDWNVVNYE